MEFLNLVIILVTGILVLRDKERLAFRLLVASILLMVLLFAVATRTSLLPGVNY